MKKLILICTLASSLAHAEKIHVLDCSNPSGSISLTAVMQVSDNSVDGVSAGEATIYARRLDFMGEVLKIPKMANAKLSLFETGSGPEYTISNFSELLNQLKSIKVPVQGKNILKLKDGKSIEVVCHAFFQQS